MRGPWLQKVLRRQPLARQQLACNSCCQGECCVAAGRLAGAHVLRGTAAFFAPQKWRKEVALLCPPPARLTQPPQPPTIPCCCSYFFDRPDDEAPDNRLQNTQNGASAVRRTPASKSFAGQLAAAGAQQQHLKGAPAVQLTYA